MKPLRVLALRVVCSWCHWQMEKGDPGAMTTHSICTPCQHKHFPTTA